MVLASGRDLSVAFLSCAQLALRSCTFWHCPGGLDVWMVMRSFGVIYPPALVLVRVAVLPSAYGFY